MRPFGWMMNRSIATPSRPTASPPMTAVAQKFMPRISRLYPKYDPSMKNAPWARFGIRINPKISEKPDDNKNSRPPKATLFSVWMIQNCPCIP